MTVVNAEAYDRKYRALQLMGHATGSEQVCAAISGIVYALAGYLVNDRHVEIIDMRLEPGNVSMIWEGRKQDLAALRMACIGLAQIEKKEPDFIKTEISEKIFENFS